MPYSRTSLTRYRRPYRRRFYRRRFYRRRRGPYQRDINIHPVSFFGRPLQTLAPTKLKRTLRFALNSGDARAVDSTAGTTTDYVYRANDVYDPYYTGAGAQPRGFDQYMALYRGFTVIGSKCFCRFYFQDNIQSANNSMKVGIVLTDYSSAISAPSLISESPHANVKLLVSGTEPTMVQKGFSVRKYMNRRNPLDDSDLAGTASASPTDVSYFHILGFALNGQTETAYVDGYIDYIVVFHTPITPGQS